MIRRSALLIALLMAAISVAPSPAAIAAEDEEAQEEEIDHVALAARLVQDGHYDRAELTLAEVDLSAEDVDKKLYYVLRGLIALQKQSYDAAAKSFADAVRAGNTDPLVFINLARAKFGMKKYRDAVLALDRGGAAARAEPQAELLKSRAYWELDQPEEALTVLARARKRFPDAIDFARTEIFYLIKLELFQELAQRSGAFLERSDIVADDLAAIGEALRQSGQLEVAAQTLEAARLRFPDEEKLTVQLARVLMDQGQLLSSAMLLEHAARLNPKYLVEAAELYRQAGNLERALYINARIADQPSKMKQRLQILLQLERYDMISAMEARLSRLGLLSEDQIRYAIAYGYFEIRDFKAAERHLKQLTDPDLFEKGITLRKAIDACREAGWLCM